MAAQAVRRRRGRRGIDFERRVHHNAIGLAGRVLIAIGPRTYMLLGRQLAATDPCSLSRTLPVSLRRRFHVKS